MYREYDRNKDKKHSARYLQKVDYTYIFNAASGLYEPKTYASKKEIGKETPGTIKGRPLWVSTKLGFFNASIAIVGLLISVFTLLLLVLTVAYARDQWRQMILANKAATDGLNQSRDQFTADERPFVMVSKHEQISLGENVPVGYNIWDTNFGRSPAVHVRVVAHVFHGAKALSKADEWFLKLPTNPAKFSKGRLVRLPENVIPQGMLTPNDWFTAFSEDKIDGTELVFLQNHDFVIAVVGRIFYSDMSNHPYYTDFCFSNLVNGAKPLCPNHNEVH